MTAAEQRAYVLADNKLALNAGWDEELLALELKELMAADLDFHIGVTGFTIAEVDQLVEGLAPEEPGDPADDRLPDLDRVPKRCKPGDLWGLGPHRLVCGDALNPEVAAVLMDGEKAEMVFTDPQCQWPRQDPSSRICHGVGRDDSRSVRRFPVLDLRQSGRP